jgi:hypothetical protein
VSHAYGRIKATLERRGTRRDTRIEDFDAAIAAHAVAFGSTLVTANLSSEENPVHPCPLGQGQGLITDLMSPRSGP